MRVRGVARAAVLAIALLSLALGAPAARAKDRRPAGPRLDTPAADTLLTRGARARELEGWVAGASLEDLVWLLRRPASELGASGPILARAALAKAPGSRAALRARLAAMAGPDPREKRPVPVVTALPRPRASVFRVGAMLPDSGDYADYARSVVFGLEAGLHSIPAGGARTIDLEFWATRDDDPARIAAVLEAASWREGVLVGELLSAPTLAIATGARLVQLPLVSPTATNEAIGTIGPWTFQIGPSGWTRGERLARLMITRPGMRVGLLTSGPPEKDPFALGFGAVAESLGARVEWKYGYSPGTIFRGEVQQLATKSLDVLLWDGEPREVEALLREMARQKVSVQLGGGEALTPERLHSETRLLLEGVRYVAEEWRLGLHEQALLDSALTAKGAGPATPLSVRGWLAGRAIARAVAGGALCPEELVADLERRCAPGPWLASRRFLDVSPDGVALSLFTVQRGRAVIVPQPQ